MVKFKYLNDGTLIQHYSDAGFVLLQNETGAKYSDPIDVVPCQYTYTETDELVERDGAEGEGAPEDEISGEEFLEMVKEVL